MVICIVQHICLLGLLATTHSYLFNTAGRRGAKRRQEPESSHRTGHPGQTTPWEGKHWGWQEGERCRSLSSCDDVHDWRKPSRGKLLTLFLFRDAQRQTEAAGNTAGCLWVTEGFFSITVRILQAFQLLLQISFNYLPINEQAKRALLWLTHCKLKSYRWVSCQHFTDYYVFEDSMLFLLLFNWLQISGSLSSVCS